MVLLSVRVLSVVVLTVSALFQSIYFCGQSQVYLQQQLQQVLRPNAAQGAPSGGSASEAPLLTPELTQPNPATAPTHTVAGYPSVSVKQEPIDPSPAMAPPPSYAESASLKAEARLSSDSSETEASTVGLPNPPAAVPQQQSHALPSSSTATSRTRRQQPRASLDRAPSVATTVSVMSVGKCLRLCLCQCVTLR